MIRGKLRIPAEATLETIQTMVEDIRGIAYPDESDALTERVITFEVPLNQRVENPSPFALMVARVDGHHKRSSHWWGILSAVDAAERWQQIQDFATCAGWPAPEVEA